MKRWEYKQLNYTPCDYGAISFVVMAFGFGLPAQDYRLSCPQYDAKKKSAWSKNHGACCIILAIWDPWMLKAARYKFKYQCNWNLITWMTLLTCICGENKFPRISKQSQFVGEKTCGELEILSDILRPAERPTGTFFRAKKGQDAHRMPWKWAVHQNFYGTQLIPPDLRSSGRADLDRCSGWRKPERSSPYLIPLRRFTQKVLVSTLV